MLESNFLGNRSRETSPGAKNILRFNTEKHNKRELNVNEYISSLSERKKPLISKKKYNVSKRVIELERIKDDFYLSLLDWSAKNQIAISQSNKVRLFNENKSKYKDLEPLYNQTVSSIKFNERYSFIKKAASFSL